VILSVCPNPCLDVCYYTGVLKEDDTNRVKNPFLSPGGKGVNAARVIARFDGNSHLVVPLGGCIGRCVRELLEREEVECIIVEVESETRVNTILEQKSKGKHILIAARGAELKREEIKKLHYAVCKDLEPDYIILGGSVPPGLPDTFYAAIIKNYKGTKTRILVDADGEILRKAVAESPFAVKPNKHELERLVGRPLYSIDEIVEASKEIVEKGVEAVIVSLGEYGVICTTEERVLRVIPPKVEVANTVGAGDALVGGFIFALHRGEELEEALRFGVACGTATVMEEGVKLCKPERVKELFHSVIVTEL
jgi:1-phosphofructokinase family hexose kinase